MRAGGAKSILVASFNVVSAGSITRKAKRNLFFVIGKRKLCNCGCSGFHTMQAVFQVLAWSMQHLMTGTAPGARHDGTPWTAEDIKFRVPAGTPLPPAALLQIRGDWEWLSQAFRFRSPSSAEFCWQCDAAKSGPNAFTDFTPQAAHRLTRFGHEGYMERCIAQAEQPANIFRCPGTTLSHIAIDAMHAGDLGCFQDAIGSLFWLEITWKTVHSNQRVGLKSLNAELEAFYAVNRDLGLSPITNLSKSQIRSDVPGYPYLKAKAAQTRHVADFALLLARRHEHGDAHRPAFSFRPGHRLADRLQEHQALVSSVMEGMVMFHRSCQAEPFDAERCRSAMFQFLQGMGQLNHMWRQGLADNLVSAQPWHIRPKSHMLQHLVQDQLDSWGSPSAFWCYSDESFVGSIKNVAMATKHPATLEDRVSEKVVLLAGVEHYRRLHGLQ